MRRMKSLARHVQEILQISKELSTDEVRELTDKGFRIALVGSVMRTHDVAEQLLEGLPLPERERSRAFLVCSSTVPSEPVDILIDCGGADESLLGEHYTWLLPEHGSAVARRIVGDLPGLAVALARRFPIFREPAIEYLIREASRVNGQIAMLSAIPGIIPVASVFLPPAAVADIVMLTKNQILLLLKIAAALGLSYHTRDRLKEIVPVVAGAMGWRSLAREFVGIVPGGVGVLVKGAIAYAGTYVVGKSAYWFWTTGEHLSRKQKEKLYRQMLEEATRMLTPPAAGNMPNTEQEETSAPDHREEV
ncbi:MAG: hypothetical protein KatS3mg022_1840 [Armatimonadota bacterium]|nr:MAG: hypothetical protein KatS3mg022_1840 [Armatimonadota bacterium]